MLQKVKTVCIILLSVVLFFFFVWETWNFLSRKFLEKQLTHFFKVKTTFRGYSFNPFTGIKIDSVRAGDIFFADRIRLRLGVFEFLKEKNLRSLSIDSLYLNIDSFPHTGKKGTSRTGFSFNIPLILNSLNINSLVLVKESKQNILRGICASMEGSPRNLILTLCIDTINFGPLKNGTVFLKLHKEGDKLCLNNINVRADSILVEEITGYLTEEEVKLQGGNLLWKNVKIEEPYLTYRFENRKGVFRASFFSLKGKDLKNLESDFLISGDTIFLHRISFDYRNNFLEGSGFIEKKGLNFKFHIQHLYLDEGNFKAHATGYLEGNPEEFKGKASLEDTYFNEATLGSISFDFIKRKNYFFLNNLYLENNKSTLSGNLVLCADTIRAVVNGFLHLEDFNIKNLKKGTLLLEVSFLKHDTNFYTNSSLTAEGIETNFLKVKEAKFNIYSRTSRTQYLSLMVENIETPELSLDSAFCNSEIHDFKDVSLNLSFYQKENTLGFASRIRILKDTLEVFMDEISGEIGGAKISNSETVVFKKERQRIGFRTGKINLNGGYVDIHGVTDLADGTVSLELETEDLVLKGLSGIYGKFHSSTLITGTLAKPEVSVNLIAEDFVYKDFSAQFITLRGKYENQYIILDTVSIQDPKASFSFKTKHPFLLSFRPLKAGPLLEEPFYASIRMNIFSAELLNKFMGKLFVFQEGNANGNVEIYGTLRHPLFNGTVYLTDLSGFFTPLEIPFDSSKMKINMGGDTWSLENIEFYTSSGKLTGKGEIINTPSFFSRLHLLLNGKNVEVYPTYDLYSRVSGTLEVEKIGPRVYVKGDLFTEEADLYAGFRKREKSKTRMSSSLYIDLNIHSDGNTYLENELAEIEFKGDLNYKFDGWRTILQGEFTTIQGTFLYIDRVFDIYEGRIIFDKTEGINPQLDIKARTEVDSYTVYLNLKGTLEKPEVTLYSEPELSEPDIVSLLSFGKPLRDVPLSVSDMNTIKSRAFNLAEGILSRNLKRKLKIRELQIGTGLAGEDPHFTVGFYLSRNLFFRYTHDFIEIDKDIFYLRYKLRRGFGIYAEKDKEGEFSLGFEYEFEF